jgi:hypothetical protein
MLISHRPRRAWSSLATWLAILAVAACSTTTSDQPVPVASLDINPGSVSITVGQQATISATPKSSSGQPMTARTVTWSSSATTVASVNNAGVVLGVSAGNATIIAASEGVTNQVAVTVTARPRIGAAPASLTFNAVGSTPAAQSVSITNVGGGILSGLAATVQYGAGASGWLTTSFNTTSAPATLSVQPNIAGVPGGNFNATISVAAAGAENSGLQIPVTLIVTQAFTLTISASGNGSGQVTSDRAGLSGSAINCTVTAGVPSGTCAVSYASNTPVTLRATAASGSSFSGWTGGGCTGTGTCLVTINQNTTVQAGFADLCVARPYTIGSTVNGTITTTSCPTVLNRGDYYSYTTTAQTFAAFRVSSPGFSPGIFPAIPPNARIYGFGALTDVFALVKSGTTRLFVYTTDSTRLGSYTLFSTLNPALTSCVIFTTVGVSASFTLPSSCTNSTVATGFFAHVFYTNVPVGATVRVTVSSTQFSPSVQIRDSNNNVLASNSAATGASVTLSVTNTDAIYSPIIIVTTRTAGQTGAYSITIDP